MLIEDKQFDALDFATQPLPQGKYEYCTFKGCRFAGVDLSGFRFLETEFIDCDFSNATVIELALQEVSFNRCKLLGWRFEDCSSMGFAAAFRHSSLAHSTFYRMDLTRCSFEECQLEGADFTEANLTKVTLSQCDLLQVTFERSNLQGADFRQATRYRIDPEVNRMKGAKFSLPDVVGLLTKYGIKVD